MSGPWEKFANRGSSQASEPAEDGPWAKFTAPNAEVEPAKTGKLTSGIRGAAQGLSLGFGDEIQGALEAGGQAIGIRGLGRNDFDQSFQKPTWDGQKLKEEYVRARDEARGADRDAKTANPISYLAGEIVGGFAGAKTIPVSKVSNLKGAVASGAGFGAATGLGSSDAESLGGMAADTAVGAGIGALGGAAGYGVLTGSAKLANKFNSMTTPAKQSVGQMLRITSKEDSKAIEAAARELGVTPSPGMLNDSALLEGLESSLHQSPSVAGYLTRKTTNPVLQKLDSVPQAALKEASSLSPYEVGEGVKAGIEKSVGATSKRLGAPFDALREATQNIAPNPKTLNRVSKNVLGLDDVRLAPGSTWAGKAKSYSEWLQNAKSVDDVKKLRGIVGKEFEGSEGMDRQVLGAIYDKLTRLEESSIMRGAADTMRSFAKKPDGKTGDALSLKGGAIGADMVQELRSAKRDWSTFAKGLESLSSEAGFSNIRGPTQFIGAVKNVDSEKIVSKLFNTGNKDLLTKMQSSFPQEYALLRSGKLGELQRQVQNADGSISNPRFYNAIKSLGDDTLGMIFGKDQPKTFKAAQTLARALPEKIGPSGTPQGQMFAETLNPLFQARELGRYAQYKALSSDTLQRVAEKLMESPKFRQVAEADPKAFKGIVLQFSQRMNALGEGAPGRVADERLRLEPGDRDRAPSNDPNEPRKGPEKWVSDGAEKLASHDPSLELSEEQKSDPKIRSMLMAASDLKPGSRAMQSLAQKINGRIGRGN